MQFVNMYDVDLQRPTGAQRLSQAICEGDSNAHRIGAKVTDGGAPVTLGGTCIGKVVRADNATVTLTGVIDGDTAYITLDQASCAVEGPITVAVCWVSGTDVTTLLIAYGMVLNTATGTIVDPGHAFPDLEAVAGQYAGLQQAYSALAARLETAIAAVSTDTELTDIRVRPDGVTESTAGDAVRAQFSMARDSDYAVYEHVVDAALWTGAYYTVGAGARYSSDSMLALVTDTFLPESWGLITVDGDSDQLYGFRLHGWDETGTYAGFLVPGTWEWSTSGDDYVRGQMPVRINLDKVRDLYPGYRFKILVRGRTHDPASGQTLDPSVKGLIHIWEKRVSESPKSIDWGWTVGGLSAETGLPNGMTTRIRSAHVACGAGTRLTFSGLGYAGVYVFEYGPDWSYVGSSGAWVRRWTVHTDGFIRVLLRHSDDSAIGGADDIAGLNALLTCADYVPHACRLPDGFEETGWVMGGLNSGAIDGGSNSGLVTRDIIRFANDTALDFDPTAYRAVVGYYDESGTYLAATSWNGTGRLSIPAGARARIVMRYYDASPATPALSAAFRLREEDGLIWYGGQATEGAFVLTPQTGVLITVSVRYSGRGLSVRCSSDTYQVRWTGYDAGGWMTPGKRLIGWASAAYVDPECYYRIMLHRADGEAIGDAERDTALAQLVWTYEENVGPGIAAAGAAALETIDLGGIPSYYTDHIASKAAAVNALRQDGCVQFALITDYHINQYGGNTNHSGALLQYLADNTMVDFAVNGGDVASGLADWDGGPADQALFRKLVRQACAYMSPRGVPAYFVAGNHDGGISGGTTYDQLISADELYRISGLQAMRGVVTVDPSSPFQYYWDDSAHNMRFIVSGLGLTDVLTGETGANAFHFLSQALKTAPAGSGIIVFLHMILQIPGTTLTTRGAQLAEMCANYNARLDTAVVGYPSTAQDYSGCTGKVLAIIGGHSHFDWSGTAGGGDRTIGEETVTVDGVPVIVTTCDVGSGQIDESGDPDPRQTGTVDEQAFDVYTVDPATGSIWATRIGGGEDREWLPE